MGEPTKQNTNETPLDEQDSQTDAVTASEDACDADLADTKCDTPSNQDDMLVSDETSDTPAPEPLDGEPMSATAEGEIAPEEPDPAGMPDDDNVTAQETPTPAEEAPEHADDAPEETPAPSDDAAEETSASSDGNEAIQESKKDSPEPTLDDTVSKEPSTARIPQADHDTQDGTDTSLSDVARTAGKYARGRMSRFQAFLTEHVALVGIICACLLAAIFGIVLYARDRASMPEIEAIERDARNHFSNASYNPGTFGSDESLSLTSVTISGRQKDKDNIDACTAKVELLYTSSSVESSQRAVLGYVRKDGIWECVEASAPTDTIYSAKNGISDQALLSGIDTILRKAETAYKSTDENSSLSLLTLYRDADITVVDRFFDESAQSYNAMLHLSRNSTFTAYECTVTANFAFRQGTGVWELTKATASSGAKEVVLTPIIGTWQGSFQKQETEGSKCFGAKEGGITISIKSVDAGKISGTFSSVAHFHTPPSADVDTSADDADVTEVAFEGKVDASSSGISFTCTTPEDARGRLTLRLDFGSSDNPESATASLTSEYDYQDILLFIPYDRTASFTDTFTLTKV